MMGSGTTGKMAKTLKRNFIGIEIAKEYMEIAEKRINERLRQEVLSYRVYHKECL
jgi:DNA modification methylase